MPIYEYKCKKCGWTFEFLVRESVKPECPKCKSKRLEKLLSTFSAGVPKDSCACPAGRMGVKKRGCVHSGGCCCGS